MSVIRGTALLNYAAVVEEVGGNADALLYAAGVAPGDAGDHEVFLSYRSVVLAVDGAAAATGTPDFGRRLATRQGIEILGPVGVAARTAPTMGDALRICSTYLSAYSPAVEVALVPEGFRTTIELRIADRDLPAHPQTYELSLGVALQVFRFLRGVDYQPLEVMLPHAPLAGQADYRAYFGCAPRFEQRVAGFALRTTDLSQPVSSDVLAHEAVVRYLDGIVRHVDDGLSKPVADLIRRLLPTGAIDMELVASQFALHPKTLQRRLADEGTTFAALMEDTRRDVAQRYLRDTVLSLTQVARELGYAEQSVLSRSCRRWFGVGPSALRRQLRGQADTIGAGR